MKGTSDDAGLENLSVTRTRYCTLDVGGWMDEMDGLRDGWLVGCLFDGTNEWLQGSVECTYANIKHSASEQSE